MNATCREGLNLSLLHSAMFGVSDGSEGSVAGGIAVRAGSTRENQDKRPGWRTRGVCRFFFLCACLLVASFP